MEKNKNVKESTEQLHGILGLMDKMNEFVKKNGFKGVFTSLLTMFIAGSIGFLIFNPSAIFQYYEKYAERKHEAGIKQRLESAPHILNYLNEFRNEVGADRTSVFEAHNGGSNLTNLPFLYADLTYLSPNGKYEYIENEYKNFRLTKYPWAMYVIEHNYWFGSIEEIKNSDPELYYRLHNDNVTHMGMYVMYNKNGIPSACLVAVYFDGDETRLNEQKILKSLHVYSSLINSYLIGK